MFGTLDDIERVFEIEKLNQNKLDSLKKRLVSEGNVLDSEIHSQIKYVKDLMTIKTPSMNRIKRALQVVEWKAELVKYDFIEEQTNILVHYHFRSNESRW